MRNPLKLVILSCLLSLSALSTHAQSAPTGFMVMNGSNIVDSTGAPASNAQLCTKISSASGSALSVQVGSNGHTVLPQTCVAITNGGFSLNVPDTSKTFPLNACVSVTATDNNTGNDLLGSGYSCLQPASTGQTSWCSATSNTCDFDLYKSVNTPPQALIQTGPKGVQGQPGCTVGATGCTNVVSLAPGSGQTIVQPSGTTLAVNSLNGVLNAAEFPGADLGAQVNAAIAALPFMPVKAGTGDTPQTCGVVQIPNGHYSFATTIVKSDCVTIEGNGSQIVYTGSGIALTVGNVPSTSYADVSGGISNLWIQGPGTANGTGLAGIGLLVGGDPSGSTVANFGSYAQNFYNLHIEGFQTGIMLGRFSSLDNFHGGFIGNNSQGVWAPGNTVGAGENVDFFGTVINNNFVVGIQNDLCYEIKMFGGSVDYTGGVPGQPFYNGIKQAVSGSCVTFAGHGVHFEQNAGPIINQTAAGGTVDIHGGALYTSGGSGTTDTTFVVVAGTNNSLVLEGVSITSGHPMAAMVQWADTGTNGSLSIQDTTGPNYIPVQGTISNIANWHVYSGNRLWGQVFSSVDGTFAPGALSVTGTPSTLTQVGGNFSLGWNTTTGSGTTEFYNNVGAGNTGGFNFFENDGGGNGTVLGRVGTDGTIMGTNGVGIASGNIVWTNGNANPPSGANTCKTGSLYSNLLGTAGAGNTFWVCVNGAWSAVK